MVNKYGDGYTKAMLPIQCLAILSNAAITMLLLSLTNSTPRLHSDTVTDMLHLDRLV